MTYKNNSKVVKKFYGVEFLPGDIKSVKGYINDPDMVKVEVEPVKKMLKLNKSSDKTDSSTQK